jgi:hypothetical protein
MVEQGEGGHPQIDYMAIRPFFCKFFSFIYTKAKRTNSFGFTTLIMNQK